MSDARWQLNCTSDLGSALPLPPSRQYETEPGLVGAYIQFLAAHGSGDPLPELAETVVDLAQLVVERSAVVAALLPAEPGRNAADYRTLHALLHIFNAYMQQVRSWQCLNYTAVYLA